VTSRTGIDTGGTFTDLVWHHQGRLLVHKVRSDPSDPARAILGGLEQLTGGAHGDLIHGSTVATNAVLERKGARVALVTTFGFEDVIRIGRQTRPALYDFFVAGPREIVEPDLSFGVPGRLDATGGVIEPLPSGALDDLLRRLRAAGPEIAAICLLHSYANPDQEREVAERLRAAGIAVCASHEVLPEYREYERWSTTVLNAYVTPVIDRYLATLSRSLPSARLSIVQSNGGAMSASTARAQAIRTVLSGPAGGVVGATAVARQAGIDRIVAFDMGGTSTDVTLIDRAVPTTVESTVGDFPMRLPVIDIHTVGAGGGSIARADAGGALRVGPDSAGADPGPACYGRGEAFTVTDAQLVLGRIDPARFLGGRMRLDAARARAAADRLGRTLGLDAVTVADGVLRVANATMERAIRVVSLERGHDPRAFTLVAFGGAGGMHASELAAELGMASVLVPRHAGVLSALGMLMADVKHDYSASVIAASGVAGTADLIGPLRKLVERASADLARDGFPPDRRVIERRLDARYVGQSYEIEVPFSRRYREAFDREHHRLYGYSDPTRPVEVTAVRVKAAGVTEKPALRFERPRSHAARPFATAAAWFGGRPLRTARYDWDALRPGDHARGPAIVTGAEASIVVPPRFRFVVDGHRNVIIRSHRGQGRRS
jgi:N-methylhydantoinase A/oxoprolinase/acetone carboxylase beta subunit